MATNKTRAGRLLNSTAQLCAYPEQIAALMAGGDTAGAWKMVMQMQAQVDQVQPQVDAWLAKLTEAERLKRKRAAKKHRKLPAKLLRKQVKDLLTVYTHVQLAEQIGTLSNTAPSIGAVIRWSLGKQLAGTQHSRAVALLHNRWQRPV
jgi:hypothetical protein